MFLSGARQIVKGLTDKIVTIQSSNSEECETCAEGHAKTELLPAARFLGAGLSISRILLNGNEVIVVRGSDQEFSGDDYLEYLSKEELEEISGIADIKRYQSAAAGRVLRRVALSMVVNGRIQPEDWEFKTTENGKPEVCNPDWQPAFSVTHCDSTTFIAVSDWCEIGIDAERDSPDLEQGFLQDVLSAREYSILKYKDKNILSALFSELWTLKEAYTKLLGTGLALDLRQVAFQLNPPRLERPERDVSAHFITWTGWGAYHQCHVAVALR